MRKIMTSLGLGLALTVGTAGVVAAQSARPDTARPERSDRGDRGEHGDGGMRRRGGPDGALLKGITLSEAQKTQLATLRESQRVEMQKNREQFSAERKEVRQAREKGDTATARAKMTALRTQLTQQRERHIGSVRAILTAEQRTKFDANVSALEERGKRGASGERGPRGDHQRRGARSGR